MQLRAEFANPRLQLLPGQFVTVASSPASTTDVFLVPQTAVLQTETGRLVWIVGADGKAAPRAGRRPATGSGRTGSIRQGLQRGRPVIVDNLLKVRPGAAGDRTGAVRRQARRRPPRASRAAQRRERHVLAVLHRPADLRRRHRDHHRARRPGRGADRCRSRSIPRSRRRRSSITATYPGASAETLAKTVAAPIEEQLSGVENLIYFSSSSASNGTLTITATFEVGTDVDKAVFNVNNRVQIALPRLPDEVRRNGVIVQKRSNDILLVVALRLARHRATTRCSCRTTRRSTWSTS